MNKWGRGKYGTTGGQAVAARFEDLSGGFIKSSPDSARGFKARLNYLMKHEGGGEALLAAGVKPRPKKIVDWLTGDVKPGAKSRRGVDEAYRALRRRNMARALRAKFRHSRRVTVQPLPYGKLPAQKQKRGQQFEQQPDKSFTVSPGQWDDLIDQWEEGDQEGLDESWMDVVDADAGSPPEAFYEVAYVGF